MRCKYFKASRGSWKHNQAEHSDLPFSSGIQDILASISTRKQSLDADAAITALRRIAGTPKGITISRQSGFVTLMVQLTGKANTFKPDAVASISWSCAKLSYLDRPLLSAISASSIPRCTEYNSKQLSSTVWAFSKLHVYDQPLLSALAAASLPRITDFSAFDMSGIAWSVATLEFINGPLLDALSASSRRTIQVWDARGLANLAWSESILVYRH